MRQKGLRVIQLCISFLSTMLLADTPPQSIPSIYVSAQKNQPPPLSGPSTLITQQQIQATGVTNLAQALQNLGGVQLEDLTGNGSQVALSMRGFGANANSNILLMVNGIPLTNPDMAPPDLNVIPPRDIKYIEVIAGSESVQYGDQAVGGVINIVTEPHSPEKVVMACGSGSYRQYNCYLTLKQTIKQSSYTIDLLKNHTDNYRAHNQYGQDRFLGEAFYPYATGQLALQYQITEEAMQYPGALTGAQAATNRRQASNDTDFFDDWHDFFQLKQQQTLTDHWQLENQLAYRQMKGHGVLTSPFQQSRDTLFFKPLLIGQINQITLTPGFELEKDDYHLGSRFGSTDVTQGKAGLFLEGNSPLRSWLNFTAGARSALQSSDLLETGADNHNLNRALATNVGLSYRINDNTEGYLRRAGSFRFPKADENAATPAGIHGLRTQRGIADETGIQWKNAGTQLKLNLYQLALKDEIAFDPTQTPETPFGINRNLSPTIRRGFTLSGQQSITAQLSVNGQFNNVDARFQHGLYTGKRIPLVAENIIRAGIQDQLSDHWQAYAEALFTGNQYADNDNANVGGTLGGYTTYNVSLHYRYQQLSLSLRLNNIFNKDYYLYTVYESNLDSLLFYPAPGRNFTLNINYVFA